MLGDGIRSEIEAVRGFLEAAAGMRSRLALVEVTSWTDKSGRMLITPQVALRTKVIEHQAAPYVAGTSVAPLQAEPASSRSEEVSQSGTAKPAVLGSVHRHHALLPPRPAPSHPRTATTGSVSRCLSDLNPLPGTRSARSKQPLRYDPAATW